MSWQAYVETSLIGSGDFDKAAIFSVAGDSSWATSPNWVIKPQEMAEVVNGYKDPAKVQASGFHIAGEKYFVLRIDERSLYGRKGKEGVVIVKTKQAFLIGHYPESVQPGAASLTVEKLADYLIGVGY